MTLNQLQYFDAAARWLHFGRAAKELCISQPSLSVALSNLEQELEVALFEKTGRGVVLTPAGKVFHRQAVRILEQVAAARHDMQQFQAQGDSRVSLAYISTMAATYIPQLLSRFLKENGSAVSLHTEEMPTPWAIRGIKDGKYDLALCLKAENEPQLVQTCIYRAPYVLITPQDCALTQNATMEEVVRYPVITYRTGPARAFVETLFRRAGVQAEFCHYTYSDDAIIRLVESGVGISIVDRLPGMEQRRVKLLSVDWLEGCTHDIYLTRRADWHPGTAVARLEEFILHTL